MRLFCIDVRGGLGRGDSPTGGRSARVYAMFLYPSRATPTILVVVEVALLGYNIATCDSGPESLVTFWMISSETGVGLVVLCGAGSMWGGVEFWRAPFGSGCCCASLRGVCAVGRVCSSHNGVCIGRIASWGQNGRDASVLTMGSVGASVSDASVVLTKMGSVSDA